MEPGEASEHSTAKPESRSCVNSQLSLWTSAPERAVISSLSSRRVFLARIPKNAWLGVDIQGVTPLARHGTVRLLPTFPTH